MHLDRARQAWRWSAEAEVRTSGMTLAQLGRISKNQMSFRNVDRLLCPSNCEKYLA